VRIKRGQQARREDQRCPWESQLIGPSLAAGRKSKRTRGGTSPDRVLLVGNRSVPAGLSIKPSLPRTRFDESSDARQDKRRGAPHGPRHQGFREGPQRRKRGKCNSGLIQPTTTSASLPRQDGASAAPPTASACSALRTAAPPICSRTPVATRPRAQSVERGAFSTERPVTISLDGCRDLECACLSRRHRGR
jgi:hypothetical protein